MISAIFLFFGLLAYMVNCFRAGGFFFGGGGTISSFLCVSWEKEKFDRVVLA